MLKRAGSRDPGTGHGWHRVVPLLLACAAALALGGCQGAGSPAPAPGTVSAPASSPGGNLVVVIGDSLSTGYGSSPADAWPNLLATEPGNGSMQLQLRNAAQNGSGYLNPGANGSTFALQVEQAVTPDADLVVFFGSENDLGHDPAELGTVAARTLAAAKDRAPQAALLVVGPPAYSTPPEATRLAVRDAVKQAAQDAGARHVDPIARGWIVGDVDRLVGPDGLHPSLEGQHDLREKMEPLILEALRRQSDLATR